jgi:hypothetical protein
MKGAQWRMPPSGLKKTLEKIIISATITLKLSRILFASPIQITWQASRVQITRHNKAIRIWFGEGVRWDQNPTMLPHRATGGFLNR